MSPEEIHQPGPVTLAELESHLWEAASILRGSPVDRTDWKSYILPLLFFKRICDVWDEEYENALADEGADHEYAVERANTDFVIPDGAHWKDVRAVVKDVGTALQKALRSIEAANPGRLDGIFGDAQWTNKERLPDATLKDLLDHFSG